MNTYMEKEITGLKDTLEVLKTVQNEIKDANGKNHYVSEILPHEFKDYQVERRIYLYEATIEVAKYYQEKLGNKEYFDFGKYIGMCIDFCFGRIRFLFYLRNSEVESKLYDGIFDSHSGINEWFADKFVDLLSVCLGSTNYSHTLGSWNLKDFTYFFNRFGKEDKDNLLWKWDDFKKDIEKAKKMIDWLANLSEKKDFFEDFDKILDVYFETVFKYNTEE